MTISQRIGLFALLALAAAAALHWRSRTGQPAEKPDHFPEVVLSTDVRVQNFLSSFVDPLGDESNYSREWFKNTLEFARRQGVTDRRDLSLGFKLGTYYLAELEQARIIGVHSIDGPDGGPAKAYDFEWEPSYIVARLKEEGQPEIAKQLLSLIEEADTTENDLFVGETCTANLSGWGVWVRTVWDLRHDKAVAVIVVESAGPINGKRESSYKLVKGSPQTMPPLSIAGPR